MNVLIIGGGKVGTRVASLLMAAGHLVKVIESDPDKVIRLQRELKPETVIHGNGSEPHILEEAGIRSAQVVAAVTGQDETNLVITSLARFEFAAARTIARVNNPKNAWMFTAQMGVDVAINQADLVAHLILEEMSLGDMLTLLKLRRGQYALVEEKVHPQAQVEGKRLADLPLPPNCRLVTVIRQGELLMPDDTLVLQAADEVLAVVHNSQLAPLANLLGPVQ